MINKHFSREKSLLSVFILFSVLSCRIENDSIVDKREKSIDRLRLRYLEQGINLYYPEESDSANVPLISVFSFPDGAPSYDLCFVLWPNGRMVWSHTKLVAGSNIILFGGPPYYEKHVSEKIVKKVTDNFEKMGVFDDPYYNSEEASLTPGGDYMIFSIMYGKKAVCLMKEMFCLDYKMEYLDNLPSSDKKRYKVYLEVDKLVKTLIPPCYERELDFEYQLSVGKFDLKKGVIVSNRLREIRGARSQPSLMSCGAGPL